MTTHSSPADAGNLMPLSQRTDDEIRERARELHEQEPVIEVPDDAQVICSDDPNECARVLAWIHLGADD